MMNQILHQRKEFYSGTHRAFPPDETDRRVQPLMEGIGLESIKEITEIDRLGIPCVAAERAGARDVVMMIHAGQDLLQATVALKMEAIERYSAEYRREPLQFGSLEQIGIAHAVDPEELILPRTVEMCEPLHWSEGWELINGEEVAVPSNAVLHPYDTCGMTTALYPSDPWGLAAGNVREEAIVGGICEVIELDALSIAERNRSMGRRLMVDDDPAAAGLLDRFEDAGIAVTLWLLDGKTGVPTVAAAADDQQTRDPTMLVMGASTHPSPSIAAQHALIEAAQGRAVRLYFRDYEPERDALIRRAGYDRMKRINREWFAPAETVAIGDVPDLSTEYFDDDIRALVGAVAVHADRICVCDLQKTDIPVVRVVIPGFEVSHQSPDRVRRSR
jgi:ribosomal protein S12 methylthiotransferase accessory factor